MPSRVRTIAPLAGWMAVMRWPTPTAVTEKLLVSLKGGWPLSVTRTVTTFVLVCCETGGVQVITPVVESISIPAGADTRLNVSSFAGMSASTAVLVTFNAATSLIVCYAGIVSTGAVFTSFTTTVKLLVALRLGVPSSKTRTVTRLVLGPCASLGVQAIAPFAATVNPAGPDTSAKVSVLAGMSASVAVALTFNAVSSLIVWLAGIVSAGAVFTSLTTTVRLLVALRLGVPSSKTRTVTTLVLGPCASLGVQAIAPFAATVRPAGPGTKAQTSELASPS